MNVFLISFLVFISWCSAFAGGDARLPQKGQLHGDEDSSLLTSCSRPLESKKWNRNLDFSATEKELILGEIVEVIPMQTFLKSKGWSEAGTHSIFLVKLKSGLQAVLKFSSQQTVDNEVAAYNYARALRLRLVPPTVRRSANSIPLLRTVGFVSNGWAWDVSLQYFVPSAIRSDVKENREQLLKLVSKKDLSDWAIFYYVFGQWDDHRGNQVIDEHGGLALIDNEGIHVRLQSRWGEVPFRRVMKMMYDRAGSIPFPFHEAVTINFVTQDVFNDYFKGIVHSTNLNAYWKWLGIAKRRVREVIFWNDGIWMRDPAKEAPPSNTEFDAETLKFLALIQYDTLRAIAPPNVSDRVINDMLKRKQDVLNLARSIRR